jgi:hypothetical protein
MLFYSLQFNTQVATVQMVEVTTVSQTEPTILPTQLSEPKINTKSLKEVKSVFFTFRNLN